MAPQWTILRSFMRFRGFVAVTNEEEPRRGASVGREDSILVWLLQTTTCVRVSGSSPNLVHLASWCLMRGRAQKPPGTSMSTPARRGHHVRVCERTGGGDLRLDSASIERLTLGVGECLQHQRDHDGFRGLTVVMHSLEASVGWQRHRATIAAESQPRSKFRHSWRRFVWRAVEARAPSLCFPAMDHSAWRPVCAVRRRRARVKASLEGGSHAIDGNVYTA